MSDLPMHSPSRLLPQLLVLLSFALAVIGPATATPVPGNELPNIGTPADVIMTPREEYEIGSMITKGLRDNGQILDDLEVSEYIQSVGSTLAARAQEGTVKFTFFVVKDPGINAFALPGGFIFVNAGLILATASESELAGVLAHEVSHVTQRHMARKMQAASRASLASTAAMLASIVLGALSHSSDVGMAGVMASTSAMQQQQLNYSRENEFEADRVGIGVSAAAGYDPYAMATFFETLNRRMGGSGANAKILEFLQTHPVTTARVAEAKNRASDYPLVRPVDTTGYQLARERLKALALPTGTNPHDAYPEVAALGTDTIADFRLYGRSLALVQANLPKEAIPSLQGLVARHSDTMEYHTALGQALLAADDIEASKQVLSHAKDLFPRNVPVTVRYAETLMRANEARQAHNLLLDLFNAIPPTQDQVRLIALAANAAGESAEADYYMAEYHVMSGDLTLAIMQLRQALATPQLTPVQRSRFKARIEELKEYLPMRLQGAVDRGEPLPSKIPDERR
ncbi:MAG: M48 family metalloprotease [Pseudomonadota bacterium]|jgi:Zn-dependent protease with chaperone function